MQPTHMQIITYGLVAFFHHQMILKACLLTKGVPTIIHLNDFSSHLGIVFQKSAYKFHEI